MEGICKEAPPKKTSYTKLQKPIFTRKEQFLADDTDLYIGGLLSPDVVTLSTWGSKQFHYKRADVIRISNCFAHYGITNLITNSAKLNKIRLFQSSFAFHIPFYQNISFCILLFSFYSIVSFLFSFYVVLSFHILWYTFVHIHILSSNFAYFCILSYYSVYF